MEDSEEPLLLILDGLDELSLLGRTGAEAAKQLVEEVLTVVGIANHDTLRLRCLITGRDLAVQTVEQAFHLSTTSLHLLPYWIDKKKDTPNPEDSQDLLGTDQRDDWWQKYGRASGHGFTSMPGPIREEYLREMSGQPLLNYLLAIIYTQDPKALEGANRPTIYEQLLCDIYNRDYKKNHLPLGALTQDDFLFVLEKIAVAIWHGNGRTASLDELKKYCNSPKAQDLLKRVLTGVEHGLMRLLAAFYFRQASQHEGSARFEFTHKSFGEYLTARNIVGTLSQLCEELQRSVNMLRSTMTPENALQEWMTLCGPQPIDEDLYVFVVELIGETSMDSVENWQRFCAQLLCIVLEQGMPIGSNTERMSFKAQCQLARNAEIALLAVHCACAQRTKTVSDLAWPTPTGLREWLSWLEPAAVSSLARKSLAYIGASSRPQILDHINLYGANFIGADLKEANLREADLTGADLTEANLTGANLTETKLWKANLEGAILRRANLREAKSGGATLTKANLTEADLRETNLAGAKLEGANLERANFIGARLGGAILRRAKLRGAELGEADLREANLRGVNLERVNLAGAKLWGANLERAKLTGARLWKADLTRTNLRGASLERAKLGGTDLTGANLTEATLTRANLTDANLTRADLTGADLTGTCLRNAILTEANLTRAILTGTDLRDAKLTGAKLTGAKLEEAKHKGADLTGATLTDADLTEAILDPN